MPAPGYINPKPKGRQSTGLNFPSLGGTKIKALRLALWLKQQNKNEIMSKLKSRKLWAAIIGSVIVTAGDQFGLTPEMTQWIATIVTGYVIGQGIADAGQAAKGV